MSDSFFLCLAVIILAIRVLVHLGVIPTGKPVGMAPDVAPVCTREVF